MKHQKETEQQKQMKRKMKQMKRKMRQIKTNKKHERRVQNIAVYSTTFVLKILFCCLLIWNTNL